MKETITKGVVTNGAITKSIATGSFKPNMVLTNMSMAFFQNDADFVAGKIFPFLPVQLSTGLYNIFDLGDLARDNMQIKPAFGRVNPAMMSQRQESYNCQVSQIIVGLDQIAELNYQRAGYPGASDPRKAKVRFATEQAKLHLDLMFAKHYFNQSAWVNTMTGSTTTPTATTFYQFDNDNSDPVKLIDELKFDIKRRTRRTPNKMAVGVETFLGLKHNKTILERVKFGGSTANPATVNERVLAQLFGVKEFVVLQSSYNAAGIGEDLNMQYVCDPAGMLLCYAPEAPSIDEPSAGYTFTWDMLGNGQPMAFSQYLGENGTHTEFIEGLCSYDMKKTGDDLAVYLTQCVAATAIE